MNVGVSSEKENVKESQSQSRSVTPPLDIPIGCRVGGVTEITILPFFRKLEFFRVLHTKSHIPASNIPTRIEIPMGKLKYSMANEPKPQLKRGRPIDSKDTIPRKRKNVKFNAPEEHTNVKGLNDEIITPTEASIEQLSHEIVPVHNNEEISINFIH